MPYARPGFKRIAHRGASGEAPENTLPAFALAVNKYKVDMIEVDVRLSKDRVPVLLHDETLERTTERSGLVRRFTCEELKSFDGGFHCDPEGKGEFPYRAKGVSIPTLEEALKEFPDTNFFLEIKEKDPECVGTLLSVIQRIPRKGELLVGSFHGRVMRELRRRKPSFIRSTFGQDEVFWAYLAFRLGYKDFRPPSHHVSIPSSQYGLRLDDAGWISFLHRRGVRVYYWTIDDPREMEALLEKGADGIMTNYPDRLNRLLKS